ncbi:MAG: hypothetical protein CMI54_00225 [Parcubacteria group bacterium]|nr:hypothetical protein [Parcubacteria group bacterium]|tara:strand:- start:20784 stop:21302 length:519 start_codon:yes stop_codon:yes gene_type:complete
MKNLDIEGLKNEAPEKPKDEHEEENIAFSSRLVEYFSKKSKDFTKNNKSSLKTDQLKKVYCHGARLGKSQNVENVNFYALARVNMFLRLKAGDKMTQKESLSNTNKPTKLELEEKKSQKRLSSFIDISEGWAPSEKDFEKAQKEIDENNLKHNYEDIEDLYMEYEPIKPMWD